LLFVLTTGSSIFLGERRSTDEELVRIVRKVFDEQDYRTRPGKLEEWIANDKSKFEIEQG
jgi:hypothetical protein